MVHFLYNARYRCFNSTYSCIVAMYGCIYKPIKERQMSSGQRDITLRFLAEPSDVNFGGKVHGGDQ